MTLVNKELNCMRTTQSPDSYIITYDFTFHVHIIRFHWDFFHFSFHAEAANRKQIVNIATRGTM